MTFSLKATGRIEELPAGQGFPHSGSGDASGHVRADSLPSRLAHRRDGRGPSRADGQSWVRGGISPRVLPLAGSVLPPSIPMKCTFDPWACLGKIGVCTFRDR